MLQVLSTDNLEDDEDWDDERMFANDFRLAAMLRLRRNELLQAQQSRESSQLRVLSLLSGITKAPFCEGPLLVQLSIPVLDLLTLQTKASADEDSGTNLASGIWHFAEKLFKNPHTGKTAHLDEAFFSAAIHTIISRLISGFKQHHPRLNELFLSALKMLIRIALRQTTSDPAGATLSKVPWEPKQESRGALSIELLVQDLGQIIDLIFRNKMRSESLLSFLEHLVTNNPQGIAIPLLPVLCDQVNHCTTPLLRQHLFLFICRLIKSGYLYRDLAFFERALLAALDAFLVLVADDPLSKTHRARTLESLRNFNQLVRLHSTVLSLQAPQLKKFWAAALPLLNDFAQKVAHPAISTLARQVLAQFGERQLSAKKAAKKAAFDAKIAALNAMKAQQAAESSSSSSSSTSSTQSTEKDSTKKGDSKKSTKPSETGVSEKTSKKKQKKEKESKKKEKESKKRDRAAEAGKTDETKPKHARKR
ncbi:MAG: hypothetical protein Q8P67_21910 [archaeon]|nr:hypothetical protein [archaeon]